MRSLDGIPAITLVIGLALGFGSILSEFDLPLLRQIGHIAGGLSLLWTGAAIEHWLESGRRQPVAQKNRAARGPAALPDSLDASGRADQQKKTA